MCPTVSVAGSPLCFGAWPGLQMPPTPAPFSPTGKYVYYWAVIPQRDSALGRRGLSSPGGWEADVMVRAGLVPLEASLLGLLMAAFSPCPAVHV